MSLLDWYRRMTGSLKTQEAELTKQNTDLKAQNAALTQQVSDLKAQVIILMSRLARVGSTASAPVAPTISLGTATSTTQPVTISAQGSGATSWQMQYAIASSGGWNNFGSLSVGDTSITVTGLTDSTSYDYQIVATNAVGSTNSNIATGSTASGSSLPLLFSDNFESGNLSHTENGIAWGTAGSVAVSTQNANGGTHSAKFTMAAGSTSGAELRFDLGATYTEWQCTFDLYIPNGAESYGGAAYTHGTSNPANNKFFRLWRGDKSDGNDGYSSVYWRIGASTERGSTSGGMSQSDLQAEYGQNGSVGPNGSNGTGPDAGSSANFIALADRGTWMSIDIYCKCATAANNNGVIRIKKNGTTLINSTNLQFYPDSGNNGADFGYLLGFANSGFSADTLLFVDNVKMYAQ